MTSDSIPPTLIAATESDDPSRVPAPQGSGSSGGPGRAIRSARERAKLSLEELATMTKLARSTLDALERDDFNALNEAVYVRGYYRKCAKVLAMPEAELIAAYEKLVVPKAPQPPTKLLLGNSPAIGRPRVRRRSNAGRTVMIIVAAAIFGAIIWFVLNDPRALSSLRGTPIAAPGNSAPVPATPSVASSPAAEPAIETAPAPAIVEPGPAPSAPAPASAAPAPGSSQSAPTASAQAAAPPPAATAGAPTSSSSTTVPAAAATGPGLLSLAFKSTSWIRVEDAEGKLLLSGVIQAGDRQQVRGRPPYSLFVGNAPGVTVEYDGKTIDTTPFVKGNSTARLTVP